MSGYTQLTKGQQYQIEALLKKGHDQTRIANLLAVHKSTTSRELKRNRGLSCYRSKQAQEKAMMRRYKKSQTRIAPATWVLVEALIKKDWSPEQISGRLFQEQGLCASHERIYLHIYQDKYQGGDFHIHLCCQKKRRKRYGKQDRRGRIPNRISMDERPSIVDKESRVGDWEGDTLIGKSHRRVVSACRTENKIYGSDRIENQTNPASPPQHCAGTFSSSESSLHHHL